MYPLSANIFPKSLCEALVLQGFTVVHIPRRERPLYYLPAVVYDEMQLEAVEPPHRRLSLCRPSFHRLMVVCTLDVARHQRCGIDDGYARAFAQCACLEKQQQVKPDRSLPLDKAVVGQAVGKFLAHMVAYVAEVERLEITVLHCMVEDKDGHNFAVRHAAWPVAAAFIAGVQRVFLQFGGEILAEFIENTENFYYICICHGNGCF